MDVKICTNCLWHFPRSGVDWCTNQLVNRLNVDYLAGREPGTRCDEERKKRFFGECGIQGKLWRAI